MTGVGKVESIRSNEDLRNRKLPHPIQMFHQGAESIVREQKVTQLVNGWSTVGYGLDWEDEQEAM